MKKNQDQGFIIDINGYEDIYSNSQESVDIYSSSDRKTSKKGAKHYKKKKRGWWARRKGWQKALISCVVSLVLVAAIALGVVMSVFDYNYQNITENPEELGFENVIDENIVNIALFGIDTRDPNSFKGLSDSIMILSLNTVTKKVKIISVMRDSLVPIPVSQKNTLYTKINTAYSRGGPELAIKTLNINFGLDISEYATVNFYGMADIIDAVGGIEAELTKGEVKKSDGTQHSINGCIDEICAHLGKNPNDYHIFEAGPHTLNGIQAVAYARIRYVANIWGTNNDYGRTDRQRHVMEQLFNKALTMKKSQYVSLAKSLIPCSETSLSYAEIMGLAFDILLNSPTFEQTRMPQQNWQMKQPSGVGSVVYYDLDFAAKVIHAFIYDDIAPEDYIKENGIDKNDWYRKKFGPDKVETPSQDSSSDEPVEDVSSETDSSEDTSSAETSSDETSSDETSSDETSSEDTSSEDSSSDSSSEEGNTSEDSSTDAGTEDETPSKETGGETSEENSDQDT